MSNDINRLRELAGIKQEPVKTKTQLDEGVIGSMQEVRHVSEREDPNWDDFFNNDREAGQEPEEAGLPDYEEEDPMDIFSKGARVDYNDDEMGGEVDFDELEVPLDYELAKRGEYKGPGQSDTRHGQYDSRIQDQEYRKEKSARDAGQYSRVSEDSPESREGICMTKAGQGKKCSVQDVLADLKSGHDTALYFADESQIQQLIDAGKIDEDYFSHWMNAQEEMAHLRHEANQEFSGMQESEMDQVANSMEEDTLVSKEQRIVNDAKSMHERGMDLDSVVMSLADEYGLSPEEQFGLYNAVMGDAPGMSQEARDALDDAQERRMSRPEPNFREATDDDVKPDYIDLDNDGDTEEPMSQAADDKRYVQKDNVDEDFDNGYDKQIEVDANGYFPKGAHNSVENDAGPSSAKHGDNPMQKKMDVAESKGIHQNLVSGYRTFKKS